MMINTKVNTNKTKKQNTKKQKRPRKFDGIDLSKLSSDDSDVVKEDPLVAEVDKELASRKRAKRL